MSNERWIIETETWKKEATANWWNYSKISKVFKLVTWNWKTLKVLSELADVAVVDDHFFHRHTRLNLLVLLINQWVVGDERLTAICLFAPMSVKEGALLKSDVHDVGIGTRRHSAIDSFSFHVCRMEVVSEWVSEWASEWVVHNPPTWLFPFVSGSHHFPAAQYQSKAPH